MPKLNKTLLIANILLWTVSFLYGMYWMAVLYLLFSHTILIYAREGITTFAKLLLSIYKLLLIFICCISIRVFIFEVSFVSSESMEATLYRGDVILINKLKYGPLVPSSFAQVPWLSIFFQGSKLHAGPRKRLKGYAGVSRNDIVIFHPKNPYEAPYIKRCIGLPGEQIEMRSSVVYINGKMMSNIPKVRNFYKVYYNGSQESFYDLSVKLNFPYQVDLDQRKSQSRDVLLTIEQKTALEGWDQVDSVRIIPGKHTDFRPVFIAKADGKNLYKGTTAVTGDEFFMMGDNRNFSKDSRSWGTVPYQQLIGTTGLVFFSYLPESGTIIWKRTLKFLD